MGGVRLDPVRGCDKVSQGCKHCYAERFAERYRGVPGHPNEQGFDLRLVPGRNSMNLSTEETQDGVSAAPASVIREYRLTELRSRAECPLSGAFTAT
jgi:hypothetical protein